MVPNELTKIIQEAVLKCPKSAREVAQEMGKPYPTLMREINPDDAGAKVGVESLVTLMRTTENIQPLTYLSNVMGYLLVPLKVDIEDPDEADLMALELMEGFGRYASALKRALKKDAPESDEIREAEQAGYEAMTAIMTLVRYLRKKTDSMDRSGDNDSLAMAG